jgi:hypothetical protein
MHQSFHKLIYHEILHSPLEGVRKRTVLTKLKRLGVERILKANPKQLVVYLDSIPCVQPTLSSLVAVAGTLFHL